MKKDKKAEMYKRIEKHGNDFIKLFNLSPDTDPVKLCKQLFSLENKVHRVMCNLCNTNNVQGIAPGYAYSGRGNKVWNQIETSEEEQEKIFDGFKRKLENIIGIHSFVFFNHDPRGYALKIKDTYIQANDIRMYTDMGGYGIIAPDFNIERMKSI